MVAGQFPCHIIQLLLIVGFVAQAHVGPLGFESELHCRTSPRWALMLEVFVGPPALYRPFVWALDNR